MPPKAKLHNKNGKPKSFPKTVVNQSQPSTSESTVSELGSEENQRKFETELCWCIQQLEISLENKKLNPKQAEESLKVLKVLKNNSQPVVKKRQWMRLHFGDYRSKMATEEKKAKKVPNKISFTDMPSSSANKSTFLRKSAILSMGDNTFRFNFTPSADDQIQASDVDVTVPTEDKKETKLHNSNANSFNKRLDFTGGTLFKFNFNLDIAE